jgi:hypothetical protein
VGRPLVRAFLATGPRLWLAVAEQLILPVRDVQEITGGYWYDIYKGEHGRFRQGIQYGYAVREGWSGAPAGAGLPGVGAKGIDNMFWTSLRYYLP